MATATYNPLASVTTTSSVSSVTFSSLDTLAAGYSDLIIVARFSFSATGQPGVTINGGITGSSVISCNEQNNARSGAYNSNPSPITKDFYVDSSSPAQAILHFMDFASTTRHKHMIGQVDVPLGSFYGTGINAVRWATLSPITSITFQNGGGQQILAGSTYAIYGVIA